MRKTTLAVLAAALTFVGCGSGPDLRVTVDEPPITPKVTLDDVRCHEDGTTARATGRLTNESEEETLTFEIVVESYDQTGAYYTGAANQTPPMRPKSTTTWETKSQHGHGLLAVGGVCEVVEVYEIPPVPDDRYIDVAPDGS